MSLRTSALAALLLLGACTRLLDWEALGRAMVTDKEGSAKVGADAEPKFSVGPGDKYYLERKGYAGNRQIHVYSKNLDRTSVIDSVALRRHGRIVVISVYPGAPPPPPGWVQGK